MRPRRILVVDDEPRILDIAKYFLEQGGYQVEARTDPAEGIDAARRQSFDAVVLDIVLGDTSGYQVAGRIKRLPAHDQTPVLFMSSKVEVGDLFLKHYEGRADFIQKPFRKAELLSKVNRLIEGGADPQEGTETAAAPGR